MGNNNGFINLWRKLRDNPIYTNSKAVHIWVECLMRATYKDRTIYQGREKVQLETGQFLMGYEEFADRLNLPTSTVYFWLGEFEDNDMVKIKSNTKGTIVTIENWEEYQELKNEKKANEKPEENEKKASEKREESNNKVNKGKKGKKGNKLTTKISDILDFYSNHAKDTEHLVNHEKPTLQSGRKYIRNRLEDGFDLQQCKDAILGAIEAIESNESWWTSQRDIEGIFKTKSGKYIEMFSKWHNGDKVNSGLLKDNGNGKLDSEEKHEKKYNELVKWSPEEGG